MAEDTEARTFEQIVTRLTEVVEQLEEGELPLEASLTAFEEGVALSRAGAAKLDAAERRVEELLDTGATRSLAEGSPAPRNP